jgi:hypothetical protein
MPGHITVEVDGQTYDVDQRARDSWEAFDLICQIGDTPSVASVGAVFRYLTLLTGLSKDELVERCGGKEEDRDAVLGRLAAIVGAVVPKN